MINDGSLVVVWFFHSDQKFHPQKFPPSRIYSRIDRIGFLLSFFFLSIYLETFIKFPSSFRVWLGPAASGRPVRRWRRKVEEGSSRPSPCLPEIPPLFLCFCIFMDRSGSILNRDLAWPGPALPTPPQHPFATFPNLRWSPKINKFRIRDDHGDVVIQSNSIMPYLKSLFLPCLALAFCLPRLCMPVGDLLTRVEVVSFLCQC